MVQTPDPSANGAGSRVARVAWDDSDLSRSIIDRFESIVRRYPDRRAVKTCERTLTYDALNRTANRLARAIMARRPCRNEPVAILADDAVATVAAILAVLKTGNLYVPLDPDASEERLCSLLDDSQTRCIVTNGNLLATVERIRPPDAAIVDIDALEDASASDDLRLPLTPDTLSSIIYTSGSTGAPKGVLQDHKYILRIVRAYSEDVGISPADRLILLFSFSSNGSLGNLFGALLNGASLYCPRLNSEALSRLALWLKRDKITIYYSTASLFRSFIETLEDDEHFPTVRVVQLSAEPVVPRDVLLCRRHFNPTCSFINRFGTTEVGPFLQYKFSLASSIDGDVLPLGFAVPGVAVRIVGEGGRELPADTTGQIVVQSRYLARGYWNKPELSASRFLPDPSGGDERTYLTGDLGHMTADGCFFHLGRNDSQLKIRGYRVNATEVEKMLLTHPAIQNVAVVGQCRESGETRLVACYVSARQARVTAAELRAYLASRAPDYMVPSVFAELDALPMTATGKVDRVALAQRRFSATRFEAAVTPPRNALEQTLVALWAAVLDVEQVGIHDEFSALGGHSLNAIQLIGRIRGAFGIELDIGSFFRAGTIANVARLIVEGIERACESTGCETGLLPPSVAEP
ncbi:MAG TPA: non-ribosomal peptide synthetase [Candidatus Eisenbacteria bacterium]|nr:non-ribosomal peptide synthetase [Candidatus Eisenbacteria bacterium]